MKNLHARSSLLRGIVLTLAQGFGAFNANDLLLAEVQTDDFDTSRTLIPEGEWMFKVGKPTINSGNQKESGKPWAQVNLPLNCIDTSVLAELGVEKIGARHQFFLDLTDEGSLARGPNLNIDLGVAFEATNLRGEEANIMRMEGCSIIARIAIETNSESGKQYNKVKAISQPE